MNQAPSVKKSSRDALRVIVPSAIIGAGIASAAMISAPIGIMIMGAGVAMASVGLFCNLDLDKSPAVYHKQEQ